jgi:hypothetical protein
LAKFGLGCVLGDFFTNSSGHSVIRPHSNYKTNCPLCMYFHAKSKHLNCISFERRKDRANNSSHSTTEAFLFVSCYAHTQQLFGSVKNFGGEKKSRNLRKRFRSKVSTQGCQMVYFKTKNPNLGIFWRALEWKMWYIIRPFGIIYDHLVYVIFGRLVQFVIIWQTYFPFWYVWNKNNLATLVSSKLSAEANFEKNDTYSSLGDNNEMKCRPY